MTLRELAARIIYGGGVRRELNGRTHRFDARARAVPAVYDRELTAAYREALRPGDRAWNVGAHVGLHALQLCAVVGTTGHVLAVEPNPHARAILARNLRLNGCRATVGAYAIGERTGETMLSVDGASPMSRAGRANPLLAQTSEVRVPVRTLDELLAEHGMPRVVVMDVEGWEIAALLGAPRLLSSPDRPLLLVEMHAGAAWEWCGHSRADLDAVLARHGLAMRALDGGDPWRDLAHVAIS